MGTILISKAVSKIKHCARRRRP